MNINQLPDDCLLYIFHHFNSFEILLDCSAVCERWRHLVFERLKNVKYLSNSRDGYPASTVYFDTDDSVERTNIPKWFPKLKIYALREGFDVDVISNLAVKGLQLDLFFTDVDDITLEFPSLEMVAIQKFHSFFANDVQGPMLKQLFIHCSFSKFTRYAKYFPNLERLHIENFVEDTFYSGPVLEKIEILESCSHTQLEPCEYYGFSLADRCPALKSAYHYIQTGHEFFVNSGIKNLLLEDLVLQFDDVYEAPDWSILRLILSKYPNVKHLAIRGGSDTGISDENIPELLKLLPRIILIDIRNSKKVTEKSTEYIDRYGKHHNRSISLYYQKRPKITKKWPHLLTKHVFIGEGLDFMKYCFLMDAIQCHKRLPYLLDPFE
uniref:F-box domain-containing protein n=1 Tax=Tetranychus urticae TaxID=32264 RepID=T1KAZ4_TETUR